MPNRGGTHLLHEEDQQEASDDDGVAKGEIHGLQLGGLLHVLIDIREKMHEADTKKDRAGECIEAGEDALHKHRILDKRPQSYP